VNEADATRAVMFDHAPIGVAILDENAVVVDHNPALAQLLGAGDALAGRAFRDFMHSDDVDRDTDLRTQLLAEELPFYQVQKRLVHGSGAVIWGRLTVSRAAAGTGRFVVQVEDVTEVRRAKDLLQRRALYDHLTGLANRTLLLDRLNLTLEAHAQRNTTVGVIFLDLDHFKLVNESFGHEAGDALLIEFARRIQQAVRSGDTVARLGGDEFVVVLENVANQAAAEGLLTAITHAVQIPVLVEGREVLTTVSAGLAMAEPGIDAELLVRNADIAAYNAKVHGRARTEVFSPELRATALTKLSIEAELRTAIREGELVVHYQPVVELATRSVVAFEALVRWQHPSRGLLMPDEFIEISEQANLVVQLGAFVLHEACMFIATNPDFAGRVFVNVSTRQIGAADLARFVSSALAASGIEPHRLGLEITESGMLLATNEAHSDLQRIKDMGVDLIIDDFGTGYSALSSVLQSPVAGLKLAREFTLRLGDRATGDRISTTIATLAHSLDMYGVIEGVETEAQFTLAKRHGWTFGQGYLFGHAAAASDICFDHDGTVRVGTASLLSLRSSL